MHATGKHKRAYTRNLMIPVIGEGSFKSTKSLLNTIVFTWPESQNPKSLFRQCSRKGIGVTSKSFLFLYKNCINVQLTLEILTVF